MDDLLQLVLRKGENHGDRLKLRNHHQTGGIGCVDDIALVEQPDAGPP
jgi:hypothetical protein